MEKFSRRFTDQEVAQVLQRATELEDRRPTELPTAPGLSLADLHEIGREVGLGPDAVDAAVRSVEANARPRVAAGLVAPLSAKLSWDVPGTLTRADLERLIRLVEERVDLTGTVSEALGTVRWTSVPRGNKFERNIQVSLTPGETDTRIEVVGRYPAALRGLLQLLPAGWGAMIAGAVVASAATGLVASLAVMLGAMGVGYGIGRTIWQFLAGRNRRQVHRIAADLVDEATRLAQPE
ncbi:MAG: hypothetical protein IT352_05365 [Gemmatimonadales bacterium]|nr:hypothetical protein [Gemmatimonadales bacterium]